MSWRERIAKLLAEGKRTDLTTPGYHGTTRTFRGFENQPVKDSYMIDRALGTHVAADPALASSFPEKAIKIDKSTWGLNDMQVKGEPQILPLMIPHESRFLQATQPRYSGREAAESTWRHVLSDQTAIEQMAAEKAYTQNPEILERYLMQARNLPAQEAIPAARALVRGDTVRSEGLDMDLTRFVKNYGGKPYNDADRQAVVDLARGAWEKEGHKGIRYINTAPMEAGAPGVKDPTSYIVFDPRNIRSQFAKFDPAKMDSNDLLAGLATTTAVPGMAAVAAQDRYGEAQR